MFISPQAAWVVRDYLVYWRRWDGRGNGRSCHV